MEERLVKKKKKNMDWMEVSNKNNVLIDLWGILSYSCTSSVFQE